LRYQGEGGTVLNQRNYGLVDSSDSEAERENEEDEE